MTRSDIALINEEDPRKAIGVLPYRSNAALAERDYFHKCKLTRCIAVVKGYWIWWCSTHHQPGFISERERKDA